MAVDHVGDGLLGHPVDGAQDVVSEGGRRVDCDHAFVGHHEHGLVAAVAEPEDAVGKLVEDVSGLRDLGAFRGFGHRRRGSASALLGIEGEDGHGRCGRIALGDG